MATLQEGVATEQEPWRGQMERTISMDIREEGKDLKEAAEQTLNVILDLTMDGTIRWASQTWQTVIGTPLDSVLGKSIGDLLFGNKLVFEEAVKAMQQDDSTSRIVRFQVEMGPDSLLKPDEESQEAEDNSGEREIAITILELEAQGIMVYDRSSGGLSHVSD